MQLCILAVRSLGNGIRLVHVNLHIKNDSDCMIHLWYNLFRLSLGTTFFWSIFMFTKWLFLPHYQGINPYVFNHAILYSLMVYDVFWYFIFVYQRFDKLPLYSRRHSAYRFHVLDGNVLIFKFTSLSIKCYIYIFLEILYRYFILKSILVCLSGAKVMGK